MVLFIVLYKVVQTFEIERASNSESIGTMTVSYACQKNIIITIIIITVLIIIIIIKV